MLNFYKLKRESLEQIEMWLYDFSQKGRDL